MVICIGSIRIGFQVGVVVVFKCVVLCLAVTLLVTNPASITVMITKGWNSLEITHGELECFYFIYTCA